MIIGGMFSVDVFPMPDLSSIPFCHIYGVNLKELLAITEECFLLKRVEKANKVRSGQVVKMKKQNTYVLDFINELFRK
jgi:hypothetical protein